MVASTVNFTIEQGADFSKQLAWLQSTMQPVNLTGYSMKMVIATSRSETATTLFTLETSDLSTGNGTITFGTDPTQGQIFLLLPAAVTKNITTWSSAVYDLIVRDSLGNIKRLLQGNITVSIGVASF
jgi:hypothetical protein